jgi:hypothetical protein
MKPSGISITSHGPRGTITGEYRDPIVRVAGYSACFVLPNENIGNQEEITS